MNTLRRMMIVALSLVALGASSANATEKANPETSPTLNDGVKWRIAYYEGGAYSHYQRTLAATVRGLMKHGWIDTMDLPKLEGEETVGLWQWLATDANSDYLEFVADAHYSANWEDEARIVSASSLTERLTQRGDIDLVIAMGTWAGHDVVAADHQVNTIVMSTSDPIGAGIVKSVEDSGYRHVHAQVDPRRYERQVRVFHEIIDFKRLGVAYEDSADGRSYAAMDMVEKVAAERGFEIERCHTKTDIADAVEAENTVTTCLEELVGKVDAFYVTVQQGVSNRSIPKLVELANQHNIPTFSQSGSDEVRQGFLLSISQANFRYVGLFEAETMAKVFNGAAPNEITQLFEEPPKIAINLNTAETIGFDPPVVILGAADEIY